MFVNLHSHSTYSRQDGWGLPEEMVARAKELGHSAVAVSDHGNICAHVPLWKACQGTGIKALYGCEFYIVDDLTARVKGVESLGVDETPHVTVLALTQPGYSNLLKLSRISFQDGFYGRPRIDWETLARYSGGLAVLSGCVGGYVSRIIHGQGEDEAYEFLHHWGKRIENFYAEVNPCPGYAVSENTLLPLVRAAKAAGVPLVVTSDSHFPCAKDYRCQDVLFAFGTGRRVDDPTRTHRIPSWAYQCGVKELYERVGKACPELRSPEYDPLIRDGLRVTQELADAAEVELPRAEPLRWAGLGEFEPASVRLAMEWRKGLKRREEQGLVPQGQWSNYLARCDREWDIICKKGFADYLLIVADIIKTVKRMGAVVLTRGSAGGCCLMWAMGASVTDPILHDLSFERFFDESRNDAPDIDCDFPPAYREKALDYVRTTYGEANVAQLANFSKFSTKSAVKAVATALGIPIGEVAPLSAALSGDDDDVTGQLAALTEPRAQAVLAKYPELKIADRFVGQMNAYSIHACGVVISPTPLDNVIGVMRGKDGQVVSSIDKRGAKALGHLKMDLLSVKSLDIVARVLELIGKEPEWFETLPLDDPKALECARALMLAGVFQLDGGAAGRVAREIGLSDLRDADVAIAICRPGPAAMTYQYGLAKRYPERLEGALAKVHPIAAAIVRPTLGILAYQEQVMKLAELLARLPMSEVQLLRKGISDKLGTQADKEKAAAWVEEWRGKFVGGCVANEVDPKEADFWWSQIETHGGYSFNKAHSRTYALFAYWMFYLKCHYTNEFYTAYLENEQDGAVRKRLIKEYVALGGDVRVLDPVHSRARTYSPAPGVVVGGYADLYSIGEAAAEKLLVKGPFTGWPDLLKAMTPTLRARVEASGLPDGVIHPQALVALAPWFPVVSMPGDVQLLRERRSLWLISDLPAGRTIEQAHYADEEWSAHIWEKGLDDETVILGFVTHRDVSPKSVELLVEDETGACPVRVSAKNLKQLGPLFRELNLGDLVAVNGWWSGDTLYAKGRSVMRPRPVIKAKGKR